MREREARELEHYRMVESVCGKLEAWEQHALDQLDDLRRELKNHKGGVEYTTLAEQLVVEQEKLHSVGEELQSCEGVVRDLRGQNEGLNLECEELKAELALMHAKVRRLERSGTRTPDVGGSSGRLPRIKGLVQRGPVSHTYRVHTHQPFFRPSPRV